MQIIPDDKKTIEYPWQCRGPAELRRYRYSVDLCCEPVGDLLYCNYTIHATPWLSVFDGPGRVGDHIRTRPGIEYYWNTDSP